MTDKEKIALLIGFIRGSLQGYEYFASFSVKDAEKLIKEIQ